MKNVILLYYKYIEIKDPAHFVEEQKALCEKLGLKGRIIVSSEGLNGTCEGTKEATDAYRAALSADPRFADIQFKVAEGTPDLSAFPRLSVKVRKEIVSGHLDKTVPTVGDVNPTRITGKRLSPDELKKWYEEGRDFVVVDMRNDYEQEVGHFKGSIMSGMHNFRDLPQTAKMLKERLAKNGDSKSAEEKAILTVCTGGVRCEKASGYLVKEGFKDVYQLDGGIVSYMEKYPASDFLGSLYVFDQRHVMHFDPADKHVVVGKCAICKTASERYVDCRTDECHFHFICCEGCSDEVGRAYCPRCKINSTNDILVK